MSSKITTEKYDVVKMERLKHYLETNAEREKPRYYEIYVDNLKAVDKTNDPTCFDDYTMYMNEDSKVIKVLIYSSAENSPRNDKFIFTIINNEEERRKQDKKQSELNGFEIQNKIDSAITTERERMNTEKMKEELEAKTKQLEEAEEYIDQLTEVLQAEKEKKYNSREIQFGNIASIAIEDVIKRNPAWAKKVPLIGALSGLLETEGPAVLDGTENKTASGETTASFAKKAKESAQETGDKETNAKLAFFEQMEENFTEKQLDMVIQIIHVLATNPEQLITVYELVLPQEESDKEAA
ncbi:MAG TPA: hypothetical protein VF487_20785 [Chitinophagaceae bacterium]